MDEDSVCEGVLKQQNVDSSGMYVWEEKYFRLHVDNALLEAFDNEHTAQRGDMSICTQLSFVGAKHAKEWSLSTPCIGSYGFDVVWSSGRIWSFLAEDEFSCKQWVESINRAIDLNPLRDTAGEKSIDYDRSSDLNRKRDNSVDISDQTYIEQHSPPRRGLAHSHPTVSKYDRQYPGISHSVGFDDQVSAVPVMKSTQTQIDRSFNMSAIPNLPSRSPSDISPESGDGSNKQECAESRRTEARDSILRNVAPFNMTVETHEDDAHEFPGNTEDVQRQLTELMRRCSQLALVAEESREEAKEAKMELEMTREGQTHKIRALESKIAQLTEKDIRTAANHRNEMETALIRIQSESQSLHEASVSSFREQHRRELACLQEEIAAEKKRYSAMLMAEKADRERAEENELDLRSQLSSLRDQCKGLEKSLAAEKHAFHADREEWAREKRDLQREFDEDLTRGLAERDELVVSSQEEVKKRIAEMSLRFNRTVQDMEHSLRSSLKQELEAEKMLAIAAIEKRCSKDIEGIRRTEREKANAEVERIKRVFLDREAETAKDLHVLEELHADQIMKLENEIEMYHRRLHDESADREDARHAEARSEEDHRRSLEMQSRILEEQTRRADEIERRLSEAYDEVQEARARESMYREKLSAALEENRVQHAEINELRRQSGSDAALAQSWRAASKETELSLTSYDASLRIAREEVCMLEHSIKRLEDENVRLKQALRYADKIVYGDKGGTGHPKSKVLKKASGTPTKKGAGRVWVPNGPYGTNKENPDVNRPPVHDSSLI